MENLSFNPKKTDDNNLQKNFSKKYPTSLEKDSTDRQKKLSVTMSDQIFEIASNALENIEKFGTPEDLADMEYALTHILVNTQYKIAHRRVIAEMKVENLESLQTEEDILNYAVSITS